ncbi:uncharacterized protein CCR75_000501 [Bremia lactucae]|uniref:Acyltransferase n=1 Tax=Bremia lactucae TaxID=4779 RepID=A0A976FQJ3_BRELC|nr:hypothetical protein CCR75_000501 [Bremia lactucae]
MDASQLNRRTIQSSPKSIVELDDEDKAIAAVPVEHMSARGVFLLAMTIASFGAFTLFVLAELMHHHPRFLLTCVLQSNTHAAAQWALHLIVPSTSAAAWFPISISHAPTEMFQIVSAAPPLTPTLSFIKKIARGIRYNYMFAIYQSIGWTLYILFVGQQFFCSNFSKISNFQFCLPGSRSGQAVAAFISEVLIISSVLTLDKRRDRNLQRRRDRFVVQLNNFNNMLLLVGATMLALASEYMRLHPSPSGSSVGYPLATGIGSFALFVTALFNTYGLGGVLSTKDGWKFYQPFMGGARFVLIQIMSWTCFGAGAALQVVYLLSLTVVELELFVGAMAVAGSLYIMAEIGMMISLLVFKKSTQSLERLDKIAQADNLISEETAKEMKRTATKKTFDLASIDSSSMQYFLLTLHKRLRDFADECLGVIVVGGLANVQYAPNALVCVVFAATTNLSPAGVAFYGILTTCVEFGIVVSRSIATHLYIKDSKNGLLEEVNRYNVKYVLPQIITGCIPAVATYNHYINERAAFVPVLLITIFIYIYELTYRGNPQQTGCRERASWVKGRSILFETVKRYFSGTIIRMAPLDPKKRYVLCFHPHGIMPISIMWLQFTAQWRQLFPNFYAHILTASILHQIPLARDLLHFYGSREVSRTVFANTLRQNESVLVVPGGQAEMLHQQSAKNEVRVYTHHKGFIRLAIEHGVPLVPVLSFKEGELMDNVQAPILQRWFIEKLAFPFPHFPYGRGLLPIPRKIDIPIVVGEPLIVPHIKKPTQDDIDKVHSKYFAVLQEMFDKYKDEVGCSNFKLVYI